MDLSEEGTGAGVMEDFTDLPIAATIIFKDRPDSDERYIKCYSGGKKDELL